jgi:protein required for attachment to host cells
MKPIRTWVLIADGARARILENDGPGHGLIAKPGLVFHGDHGATHDLVSDRQGRSFSSQGPGRSAIESHSDPHRELKKAFVHQLAEVLADGIEQSSYDRLILVASPVTLGDLRTALPDKVRAVVTGEIAQDLTKTPNAEVAKHLKGVLVT